MENANIDDVVDLAVAPTAATVRPPPRDRDGSLARSERAQRPLRPNSLLWRYWGDYRVFLMASRALTAETMQPQMGAAASTGDTEFAKDPMVRLERSLPPIQRVVYGTDPGTTGVQIRNFHKQVTGIVNVGSAAYDGTRFRSLDPDVFYWAHATFLESLYTFTDRFIKPLSCAEKEQMFEESKDWFSLYGVDDRAQPANYHEFLKYWDDTVRREFVLTEGARWSVGFITDGVGHLVPKPKQIPDWLWQHTVIRLADSVIGFIGAGALEPEWREMLDLPWDARRQRRYDRFCAVLRKVSPAWERFAPLRWRYTSIAIEAFEREAIDPRKIAVGRR